MAEKCVIVDDEHVMQTAETACAELDMLNGILEDYISLLAQMSERVIQAGETAQALMVFQSFVGRLKGNLHMLGRNMRGLAADYLAAIDAADQYLY